MVLAPIYPNPISNRIRKMNRFFRKALSALGFAACVALVPISASATVWMVNHVHGGSSGFGASGFHDASGGSPMSGNALSVLGPNVFGTYNDASGLLSVDVQIDSGEGGAGFSLLGNLLFGGNVLLGPSTLFANFLGTVTDPDWGGTVLGSTTLGFRPGFVCCGSSDNDPNSFVIGPPDEAIMTLWGADGFDMTANNNTGGYTNATLLGMDLRLHMTKTGGGNQIPEPGTLAVFGVGLMALGLVRMRRRRKI
jgi:PEP-CTERM motif